MAGGAGGCAFLFPAHVRVGIFLLSSQVDSHSTPGVGTLLNASSTLCSEVQTALAYFKVVPFLSSCWEHKGLFLRYLLWGPARASGDIAQNSVGFLWGRAALQPLTLKVVQSQRPAVPHPQLRFSDWPRVLQRLFGKLWWSPSTCLPFRFRRSWFALWPHISDEYKKNCWFFSLSHFLLFVKMEWWLLTSLPAGLETRSCQ